MLKFENMFLVNVKQTILIDNKQFITCILNLILRDLFKLYSAAKSMHKMPSKLLHNNVPLKAHSFTSHSTPIAAQ